MRLCSKQAEIRRCRPLLGTFVEVSAMGLSETGLQAAINAAFAAIERVQRLMSTHAPDSEISRVNREAASSRVTVSQETFEVLRRAERLAAESGGAFDVTVAPTLADWGMLPADLRRQSPGSWRDVRLFRRRQVRFLRPLALDLGGIAKGFAVDEAVKALREHGVASAMVNAGGDLRAFGPEPFSVYLRHPGNPHRLAAKLEVQNAALATSCPCFSERYFRGQRVSHLVRSPRRTAITGGISVSVLAKECWLADALTKVVLNSLARAEAVLAKHSVEAFVLCV